MGVLQSGEVGEVDDNLSALLLKIRPISIVFTQLPATYSTCLEAYIVLVGFAACLYVWIEIDVAC